MTNWTMENGSKLLHEKRMQSQAYAATQTRPQGNPVSVPVAQLLEKFDGIPPYPEDNAYQVLAHVGPTVPQIVLDDLGVVTLEQLGTAHMPAPVATEYKNGLASVRAWRQRLNQIAVNDPCGRMFVICSESTGGGKTHISEAVLASFQKVVPPSDTDEYRIYPDGKKNYSLDRRGGRFFTAKDLMDQMALIDGDKVTIHSVVRPTDGIIIIDDVGREGKRKWTSQDDDSQSKTTAQLYYDFLNHCYQRTRAGNPVNIFMTSNLMWAQIHEIFNDASISRLNEYAPKGNVWEMKGVPEYRLRKSGRIS